MQFNQIRRSTTSEMVIDEILKGVNSKQLKPGDKLPPERNLAKLFGVGRSSIREAFRALVIVGCLEIMPGKGTFIRKNINASNLFLSDLENILKEEDILDLLEMREMLECQLLQFVVDRANSEHLNHIRKTVKRMKESSHNIQNFYDADLDFHVALAEASGNRMLPKIMKIIVKMVHKRYRVMSESLMIPKKSIQTAEQIVSYITKGDVKNAAESMREHIMV